MSITSCHECGKEFFPCEISEGTRRIYCGDTCSKRARRRSKRPETKACVSCGQAFAPKPYSRKTCSDRCREDYKKSQAAAKYQRIKGTISIKRDATNPHLEVCRYCGETFETLGKRRCCSDEHSYLYLYGRPMPVEHTKLCEWCGKVFATRISKARCCSDKHAKKLAKHERKMWKLMVQHSPYSRDAIFERDNWTCHLCGQPIDCRAVAPDPASPTIDHVIPLSKGGSDTPGNLRAAHFVCNSFKSDRIL